MKVVTREQASVTAKDIMRRLEAAKLVPNRPKGVPRAPENHNSTQALYPTEHNMPADRGFDFSKMVTGSGHGPVL